MSTGVAAGSRARSGGSAVVAGGTDLARPGLLPGVRRPSRAATCTPWSARPAVAALLITREHAVTAVENKYQGDFLRDVLLRRGRRRGVRREHVAAFGWNLDRARGGGRRRDGPAGPGRAGADQTRSADVAGRFSAAWRQVCRELRRRHAQLSTSPPRWSRWCSR